jgi:hypothetical protein
MEIVSAVTTKWLNIPQVDTRTISKCCLKIIIHANEFSTDFLMVSFRIPSSTGVSGLL